MTELTQENTWDLLYNNFLFLTSAAILMTVVCLAKMMKRNRFSWLTR